MSHTIQQPVPTNKSKSEGASYQMWHQAVEQRMVSIYGIHPDEVSGDWPAYAYFSEADLRPSEVIGNLVEDGYLPEAGDWH